MTMFSAENIYKHKFCGDYSEGFGVMSSQVQGYDSCSEAFLRSNRLVGPLMGEEQSRTGSSSKDVQQEKDEGWLQLSIGGYTGREKKKDQADQSSLIGVPRPVELELLPSSSGSTALQMRPLTAPIFDVSEFSTPRPVMNFSTAADHGTLFFLQHPGTSSTFPYHQEINWAYRPIPINITPTSTSLMAPASYFPRPVQVHPRIDIPGPSLDFRVIEPPRRPHSGIWFILQASQNQGKEPFLPQISKSYLRIKDGTMTIQLVKKYLVNKLRLENESEIEITCKGRELLPFLTLQHVRDNIWSQRDFVTFLPHTTSAADHIMVLFYGRSATN